MLRGISHLGIAVKDLDQTLSALARTLGPAAPVVRVVPERHLRLAVVEVAGITLELLEDNSPSGRIATVTREKGEGFDHICFLSDNLAEDMKLLRQRGFQFLTDEPHVGLRGKRIAFAKGNPLGGMPFELSEA